LHFPEELPVGVGVLHGGLSQAALLDAERPRQRGGGGCTRI